MRHTTPDQIDEFRAAWAREIPDLDTTPMSILGRIYRVSHLMRPSIEATFARFGITRGEFDVLATLRRSAPPHRLTPTELYRSLMISSGGLTARLDSLERARLIKRESSVEDGRSRAVSLTREGVRLAEEAFRADMAAEAEWLHGLSARDRMTLAELLKRLGRAIEAAAEGPPD